MYSHCLVIIFPMVLMASSLSSVTILNEDATEISQKVSPQDICEIMEFFIETIVKDYSNSKAVAYGELKNNSFFDKNLGFIGRGLRSVDPKTLNENQRKSFFINVYNILVLDSIVRLPKVPESIESVPKFEYQNAYIIGTENYTLASIKHGVLRDNSPDVVTDEVYFDDKRRKQISVTKDPRILSALFSASESGPPLQSFNSPTLERKLNEATVRMCNDGVLLEGDSSIVINALFKDYMKDFAPSAENFLRWLSKCVENTDKKITLYFAALDRHFLTYTFRRFDSKTPVMKSKSVEGKIEVDLYIESQCPDALEFFTKQLQPSFDDIKKIMKLNIVVFGKASVTPINNGEDFEFDCQNGPLECLGNKIMSCAVVYFPVEIQVPFLTCLMTSPSISKGVKECGRKISVPTVGVEECSASVEGSQILYANGIKTLALEPSLFFVPTVSVNKMYNTSTLQNSLKHFPSFICNSYIEVYESEHGISTPSGCRVKLDIYLESLNPEVHRFFIEQLTPTWRRVGNSMDLQIIPFGKTIITNNKNDSTDDVEISSRMKCSRGPLECYGNIVMSCIAELLPTETQIRVLTCMMSKKRPSLKGRECTIQERGDWQTIDECAEGALGSTLTIRNKEKTEALIPELNTVPTVTVNKIHNTTFTEWALNDLTALICDAFLMSNELQGRVTLPKGCPVRVEIYLEILCPDTKRFILKVFHPTWKKLGSLIDLHLIPFGKANVWLTADGKDYEFECQFGPLECKGNKVISCLVEYLPTDLQVEFIVCMMESKSPSDAGEKCAKELRVAWGPLKECYTSREGSQLLFQNGIRTMNLKPTFYFVPTITINRYFDSKQLEKSLNSLEDQVCAAYQEPFKQTSKVLTPKGCKLLMEVYFIAFSEDSKTFLLSQLVPVWKKLHHVINLKLIPLGKAHEFVHDDDDFEESCRKDSHCAADIVFSCVSKHFDIEAQMMFLECSLRSNDSLVTSKECAQNHAMSWDKISNCFRGSESISQLKQDIHQTKALRPSFHSVPTVLINGFYNKQELKKSKHELQQVICNSFYDPLSSEIWKPERCPVALEVYISSLCPDTKRFFLHQIEPTWDTLSSILELKIIPFGKASAKLVGDNESSEYEFKCQHGPLECYGNKVMSCIVKRYSIDEQVKILSCMISREYPAIEGRECAEELGLSWGAIIDCIDTEGASLLYQNGVKTQNVKPKIFFIPTTTINGFYDKSTWRKSMRNLPGLVCSSYLAKMTTEELIEIPDGCKVKVKIFFHSLDDDMKLFFSNEVEEFWRIFKRIVQIQFLPLKHSLIHETHEDCRNKCYESKVLGCLTETQSTDMQMKFLVCLMSQVVPEHGIKTCSSKLKVNLEELNSCALSSKSSKILEENQEHFLKLQMPSHELPFIMVGKSLLHSEEDMRNLTCQNFHGPTPHECLRP